jgi:hypothetical protein
MIKTFLTLAAATVLIAIPAHAKTFSVPDEDSAAATINIPDSWNPEEIDNGVAGQSSDDAVYIAVVGVSSEKGMNAEIDDTFAMLKEHKVELDQSSKKENKFKINGLDASELLFQGKDEDGPAAVSITFVPVKNKLLVITYWVSTDKEAAHQEEVGKIVNSLKPAA